MRTLLSTGVSFLAMTVLLFISSQIIVMEGFTTLESDATIQNIERAENAIHGEVRKLEAIAFSWASAEETNTFMETRDYGYFQSAFPDEKFTGSNINIILFVNTEGDILNHKYINLDYGHVMPTPRSLLNQITEQDLNGYNGIIVLESGPMLIASRKATRYSGEDANGHILVGRYLDTGLMNTLSQQTELIISAYENHDPYIPSDIREVQRDLSETGMRLVRPLSEDVVAGYTLIPDINGNPALLLKAEMPRDIFKNGQAAIQYSLLSLILLGILCGAVTMGIMEKTVLSRLSLLNAKITSIHEKDSLNTRIDFDGEDEIAQVAGSVNRMLDSLEMSQSMLRQSEERFRQLFNDAHDIFFTTDRKGIITSANRMTEILTGYSKEEIIGLSLQSLIGGNALRDNHSSGEIYGMQQGEYSHSFETTIVNLNGEECVIDIHIQPRFIEGKVIGLFGIARDITEKRRAELELQRYKNHLEELVTERTAELSKMNDHLLTEIDLRRTAEKAEGVLKERLAVTLSSITDAVITIDNNGTILLVNKPATDLIRRPEEEIVGSFISTVFVLSGDAAVISADLLARRAMDENKPIKVSKGVYLEESGTPGRPIEISASPIRNQNGRATGSVIVISDITDRKRYEEESIRMEKLESIGLLAGGIAHDFNNILTAITGNLMIARMGLPDDAPASERIERAEEATLRARDMTRQLITFAKGGAPVKETADISELIRETADFVLRGTGARPEIQIDQDLWSVDVDCGQISQVISNLVINANQAMEKGGVITIRAMNKTFSEDFSSSDGSDSILITITDQGTGISQENLTKIFDPYFTTKKVGNGLGLASCLSIIQRHGGTITVDSEVGVGTTFTISLPASKKVVPSNTCEYIDEDTSGGLILVMDDDEAILDITETILTKQGYTVITARDGNEAVQLYRDSTGNGQVYDAVIMDLTIPGGMGGKETIEILKKEFPDICAVVSSGYSDDPVMSSYQEYGFSAVLPKPYRGRDLLCLLQRVLEEKREGKRKAGSLSMPEMLTDDDIFF
ncbi:PAS domain S-box protein [Methanocalculus chunghsingensis]|uniref:PAS domain S-box protein n=1 Tax=Methanocalculus chunghsingensis TaxID=156457 RepID=UPI001B8C62BC|nr:PAS domain S-box protein [Methanocalculus chunghsingensis]